jgi:NOL1/NOP2/fmu family ribosome biogenesis protein
MDVWPALKENGMLVYSTCTFNPGENEENLAWLIGKNEAECIRLDLSGFEGITEIDFEGIFGYGFYPDKTRGEGFFISAVRKKGKQEKIHFRSRKKSDLQPDKNDIEVLERWTGFSKERALKWGDELIAIPCNMADYLQIYSDLKIIKAGTTVCTVKNRNYLPSHELALSQQLKKDTFPNEEVDHSVAMAFMRRDNFAIESELKGWNILTYNGVSLGFVKNLGNRFNNYFPVEWRIRMNLPEPGHENIIEWE